MSIVLPRLPRALTEDVRNPAVGCHSRERRRHRRRVSSVAGVASRETRHDSFDGLAFLLNAAALAVQWGGLVTIVVAVITGYPSPWSQGNPLNVFGVAIPSPIASSQDFHDLMEEGHDISGHLFIPLLALHVLGAAKHVMTDKSGIARRMIKPTSGGR